MSDYPSSARITVPVSLKDILEAFEFVRAGGGDEHQAFLCKQSGKLYCHSELCDDSDILPDNIGDSEKFLQPDKRELDLGKPLALDFARQFLPGDFDDVLHFFRGRGAYARFKDLLDRVECHRLYRATKPSSRYAHGVEMLPADRGQCGAPSVVRRGCFRFSLERVGNSIGCTLSASPLAGILGRELVPFERCIMRPGFRHISTLALLISIAPGISRAEDIGWPEAVGRLAGERSKAETCTAVLKGYGDKQQISQGQLAYGEAKANFDAVIAELITALTEGGNPRNLPSLETDLEHGTAGLGKFCKMVSDLLPSTSGRKGILADIARAQFSR